MEGRSPDPLFIAALALAAAAIACIGGASSISPTEAASFATGTPGGRVSVSLLTPTQPSTDLVVQASTPIGPMATGTAQAATAMAQTQSAPLPTATIPGLLAAPAQCPAPANPRPPAQPSTFSQYDEATVLYLSAGGAPTVIEGRLAAWGAFTSYGGLVRADRDFTGDGVPEVLVVMMNPEHPEFPYPGDLYIFGCENGSYRLLYQAGHAPNRSAPLILNTEHSDVNGNRLNDLVYVVQTCNADVCSTSVEVIEWNVTLSSFDSLLAEKVEEAFAAAEVADLEDDGLAEIIVRGGQGASEAAGPQRSQTITLRWDGARYSIASAQPADGEYRIHMIVDADEALRAGDYGTAIARYQRSLNDSLRSWRYPDEAAHLQAYARFRIMLALAAQGNVGAAQAAHDELVAAYSPPPAEGSEAGGIIAGPLPANTLPGSGFVEMARLFWREYSASADLARACQVVTGYARAAPSSFEVLNSFGYANPTYTAPDLCPFGG